MNKNANENANEKEVSPEFKQPIEIKISTDDSKKYFKADTQQNQAKLRFTDVSLYSTTPYDQAVYTTDIFLSYYDEKELKEKIITDGSACIGGNTWSFAKRLKHCNAVEISKLHADILEHNMKVLGINNVTVYNDNYMNIKDDLDQDILFLDPPWGGVDYRNEMTLTYNYKGISYSLDEVLSGFLSYKAELVLLKIPYTTSKDLLKALQKTTYPYYEELTINTFDDRPIYKLIVLSHIPRKKNLPMIKFKRLGYKGIKYTKV